MIERVTSGCIDRDDDRLPYDLPDFEAALSEYYEVRGWNEGGTVPDDRLEVPASGHD